LGILGDLPRVPFQVGQIFEGIGLAKLTGVDQAHDEVAHVGAAVGFVEQGVLG